MTELKKSAKDLKKQEKAITLMKAACKVMAQKGYAKMSMQDIAKEAGVNKSLLYYYFKNKEELFVQLFRFINEKYINLISNIISLPLGIDKKLEISMQSFHQFMEDEPKWILMILDLIIQDGYKHNSKMEVIALHDHLVKMISETFSKSRNKNEIGKEFDDNVIASLIIANMIGMGTLFIMDKNLINFPKAYLYFTDMMKSFMELKAKDWNAT